MKTLKLNITDTFTPQVNYEGSVKIFYIDKSSGKSKIIYKHNSGGPGLFTAICRMLIGDNTADYIPQLLMGYFNSDTQAFTQLIGYASTPVLYESKEQNGKIVEKIAQDANNANAVQYTFMIPAANLISRTEKITKLELRNRENMICATLDLNESNEQIDTSIGSNILIYWKLKFA